MFRVQVSHPLCSFGFAFNASRHPGNIMVNFHRHYHNHREGKGRRRNQRRVNDSMLTMVPHRDSSLSPKHLDRLLGICLVDAGMVAQLTEQESSTFIGLLSSLGEGDGVSTAGASIMFRLLLAFRSVNQYKSPSYRT